MSEELFKKREIKEEKRENHIYISISQVLSYLSAPFDQQGVAKRTYENNFNNPESQYYQKTIEEIIEMWSAKGEVSMQYGKNLDEYIGCVLEGDESDVELYNLDHDTENDSRLSHHIKAFDEFYKVLKSSGYDFVTREQDVAYESKNKIKIGDKEYTFTVIGRFDALFYNKETGRYLVIDWKSSGSIDTMPKKYTGNLLGPAKIYKDLNWYTYTTQLYFYKTALLESNMLKDTTDYKDVDVRIVNLPDHDFEDGNPYCSYSPAYHYNKDFLDSVFEFAVKKKVLLDSKKSK